MLPNSARQRYHRAALQAERDARRTIQDTPQFDLGPLTLAELRGVMGVTQAQLSTILAEHTGLSWSRAQLARIENGTRNMTPALYVAIMTVIKTRRADACRNDRTSLSSSSKTLSPTDAGRINH